MAGLFAPAVAITATRRRRFLWAAWWTAPPERVPFRKPDAAEGGARSREEARRAAEKAAGRALVEIDGAWARAWARVLQGEDPWPAGTRRHAGPRRASGAAGATARSAWEVLGVAAGASLEEVKRAYRARAMATHPDRGGDAGEFREVKRAYESAVKKVARRVKKPRKR